MLFYIGVGWCDGVITNCGASIWVCTNHRQTHTSGGQEEGEEIDVICLERGLFGRPFVEIGNYVGIIVWIFKLLLLMMKMALNIHEYTD